MDEPTLEPNSPEPTPLAPKRVWSLRDVRAGLPTGLEGEIANITLEVQAGEKIALIGPEDGGKALLFKVLGGLRPIREGQISIFTHEMSGSPWWIDWDHLLPSSVRRKMGVLLEREGLLSNVSVREGLELLFRFKNGDHTKKHIDAARTMVEKLGLRFGISEVLDRRPNALTPVERRLAALARAFLSKPSALLLENPTVGFGDLTRDRLDSALAAMFSEAGRTLVVSTEDLRLARRYCRRWILVEGGTLTFDGSAEEFLSRAATPLAQKIRRVLGEAA